MLYERFVEECYEFGDGYLGEKDVPCFYGNGVNWDGINSFHIKLGCNDGTDIKAYMNEKDKNIWLMVFKNGWERKFLKKEYKHTRFLDEYFNNPKEMIKRIKEQVVLHQDYDINYTGDFEE